MAMKPSAKRKSLGAVLLVVVTVAAYIPAIRGGFVWDDDAYVTANPNLRSVEGLRRIWFERKAAPQYYPLTLTTFWLGYHLWGLQPLGYHLVNVLLHALSANLLWVALRRLRVPGGWWAAAIFALHPVHVESVAWITERKNVLSGVFYLAALLAYLRFCPLDGSRRTDSRRWGPYGLALLLFICALLSKTVACSMPAAIVLLLWWKRDRLRWADVLPLVPLFLIGAAMGLHTALLEKEHVGATGSAFAFSFLERCLIAGRALWFYPQKLLWPAKLTFMYPQWRIDAGLWWQYVYPVAAVALIVMLWLLRRRIGKGPLVALLLFGGTLLPALGFIDVYPMRYSFVADHFQYMASIGVITLLTAGICVAAERATPRKHLLPVWGRLSGGILLCVLAGLTWYQGKSYADLETLWRDTLAKNPSAWMAHNNLGIVLAKRGNLIEAADHFSAGLRLKPDDVETHNNLAGVMMAVGRLDQAIDHLTEALRLKPDYADALYNMGRAQALRQNFGQAAAHYRAVLRLSPDRLDALNALAWLLATCQGPDLPDPDQAVTLAERACELTGYRQPVVLDTLAAAYAAAGRFSEAITTAQQAMTLARAQGEEELAAAIRDRLTLYEAGRPYRQ